MHRGISGLTLIEDYITVEVERLLVAAIDAQPWQSPLKRRVQHYGYVYDYKRRHVDSTQHLGPLPPWLAELAHRLHADGTFPHVPDQCIVNEYEPGQGISAHVDCEPCFGDVIASLTLGSGCEMAFTAIDAPCRRARCS